MFTSKDLSCVFNKKSTNYFTHLFLMCNKLLAERYGFFLFKYIFVSDLAVDIQFEMNYVTLYEMLFSNYVLELRRLEIERTIN